MRNLILMLFAALACTVATAQELPVYLNDNAPVEQRVEDALRRMTLDEKIAVIHAQGIFCAPGVKRLGLPDFWVSDGPHGVRCEGVWNGVEQAGQPNDSCVAFPALSCLAATWNPAMARIYGESLGEEALYRRKDMMLGPGVNIMRTPLGGRNFEYMSEDPYLASRMVVPYVRGLQSRGVAACVKHYALNNQEYERNGVNAIVSDRALHEIYLPAFRAAIVEGGSWGIMGSYNLYNNQHNCHNEILLNNILKRDWRFDGVVVSDWGGCHDTDEAVRYGLDMEFGSWKPSTDEYFLAEPYKRLIRQGKYTTRELDDKVRRVLRLYYRTTMNSSRPRGFMCSEAHYDACLRIAQEGIVLLKNTGALLPLDAPGRVLVVGENAIKKMTVGGCSSSLKAQREVLPLDAVRARFASSQVDYARGYVGDTVRTYYGVTAGASISEMRSPRQLRDEAVAKARNADVVIVFGGLNKSPHQDSEENDRLDYALPYAQDSLVEALAAVNPRLVFVNISGNPAAMPWLGKVPAVVQGWFGGSQAGTALASVLAGDVCPSGKLPYTWYASLSQCGAHALDTYPGVWREADDITDVEYKEDVYVGYRWTDRLKKSKPLFAFGHGLSYTTFAIGGASADRKRMTRNDSITFTVDVTNTGRRAGAETVQLYIHDKKSSVDRPVKELKGFSKVYLQPGQTAKVSITVGVDALSYYSEAEGGWVAENGDFEALVGTASDRICSRIPFTLQ